MTVTDDDPDARLQRARRLDWRFVLPDPTPGRVGYLGPPDPELLAALREAGWQVTVIPSEPGPGLDPLSRDRTVPDAARPGLDLVVVARPSGRSLTLGARHVRTGGSLYVACDGPFGGSWRRPRPLDPRGVSRRLERLGFTDIRNHLIVPRRSRQSAIVPLEDDGALRLLLRRHRGVVGLRPVEIVAQALRRTSWLARIAPSSGVVARRDDDSADRGDAVSNLIGRSIADAAGEPHGPRDRPAPLLITPTFRASRHVVALVPTPDGSRPDLVAKISRQADSGAVTRREAQVLVAVASGPDVIRSSAPRLITQGTPWGLPTLVETGLNGEPLDPSAVRRDRDRAMALVIPWLAGLVQHAASLGTTPGAADRLQRLLDEPMVAFGLAMPPDDAWRQRIDATRAILEPLRSVPLPDVIEHGDVSHPNLLVAPDGAVAAVDWELGEPHGLPAHDLCGFLGYVAAASARATAPERQAAAITAAMREREGWMDRAAGDYASRIDLDPSLLPALTVASWARRVVGLVERLHDGRPRAVSRETATWLCGHRFVAAWDAALAGASEAVT